VACLLPLVVPLIILLVGDCCSTVDLSHSPLGSCSSHLSSFRFSSLWCYPLHAMSAL
jgi:hypothetical protein